DWFGEGIRLEIATCKFNSSISVGVCTSAATTANHLAGGAPGQQCDLSFSRAQCKGSYAGSRGQDRSNPHAEGLRAERRAGRVDADYGAARAGLLRLLVHRGWCAPHRSREPADEAEPVGDDQPGACPW